MDPLNDFRACHGATWCKRSCLGHLAQLPSPAAALWAGDLLHHVPKPHLTKTSDESAGLKPHKSAALKQTDSSLSPNIQDSDSANSSSYTAWEHVAVWPCRSVTGPGATRLLGKPLQQKQKFLPETPCLPYVSGPLSRISCEYTNPAVPPTLEPLLHLLRGY